MKNCKTSFFSESRCGAAVIAIILIFMPGCKAKRLVTVEQVDEIVRNHVHVGSSKQEVATFCESLKVDALKVTHSDRFYSSDLDGDLDKEKADSLGSNFKEFYDATVQDIAPTTTTMMAGIRMRFYFDENGKMLDYSIKEDSGFR
jgi:hypothetical protein